MEALFSEIEAHIANIERAAKSRSDCLETNPSHSRPFGYFEDLTSPCLRETVMGRSSDDALRSQLQRDDFRDDQREDCLISVPRGSGSRNKQKMRKIAVAKGMDSGRDTSQCLGLSEAPVRERDASVSAELDLSENAATEEAANAFFSSESRKHRKCISFAKQKTRKGSQTLGLECDESILWGSFNNDDQETVSLLNQSEEQSDMDAMREGDQRSRIVPMGAKIATAGWYVSGGEAVLLAHDDGTCSFFDVANMEEKAAYERPDESMPISFDDCWMVTAPGSDGCPRKYIVAATCGGRRDADTVGFCSWDFHDRISTAQEIDPCRKNTETSRRWHQPHGPLLASASAFHKTVSLHDIRDGAIAMSWTTKRRVLRMDFCSPLQWTAKSRLVLAQNGVISVWDVNTMDPRCLQSIELPGRQIRAFHVHAVEGNDGGGIRRRLNSSETEAYDGICCTQENMNVLDFRVPGGIGLSFPAGAGSEEENVESVFARGDAILTGGVKPTINECWMRQWSARTGKLVCTYAFPPSASDSPHLSLAQVWGSPSAVMALNGSGLHMYRGLSDGVSSVVADVEDVLGTPDLLRPSFDYAHSRVLLISGDRPAGCCFWPNT